MSIPPFPSQDLAKLVLGYLAEEQLMTAYDEFLQASPYLNLQNEYDRIFMTSLKSISAEYRAVKLYVENCTPISLRRKVFQCTNLLDIVKLLVNYVDLNKLQQEAADKANVEKHKISANASKTNCETCASSKLATCVCSKQRTLSNQPSHEGSLQNSIETTPLADLPVKLCTEQTPKLAHRERKQCHLCSRDISQKKILNKHLFKAHGLDVEKRKAFICPVVQLCSERVSCGAHFRSHLLHAHGVHEQVQQLQFHNMDACPYFEPREQKKPKTELASPSMLPDDSLQLQGTLEEGVLCEACGLVCADSESFRTHLQSHELQMYACQ